MEITDVRNLKSLEENKIRKESVAELSLDRKMLQDDVLGKLKGPLSVER